MVKIQIKNFKDKYYIGEDGNIYKKLSYHQTSNGYEYFKDKDGIHHAIHRLLAGAFIPNPNNKGVVDHINGIRNDNRIENLRWCTQSENLNYGYESGKNTPIRFFKKCDLYYKGEFINSFESIKAAAKYASEKGASESMLRKYYKNHGYEIRCIDYPEGE